MKKIIENLSDARPGDWIEAEFAECGRAHPFSGEAWENVPGSLMVGPYAVRWDHGGATTYRVKRITRTVNPLPTEPGVVFYATVRGVENVQVMVAPLKLAPYTTPHKVHEEWLHHEAHIDPESVRIVYTPEEVGQ